MIIGYEITSYDNGSFMTGSCDKLFDLPFLPKCDKCGYRTDYRYTDNNFKIKRKKLDISSTYDGIFIVSLKFKEFCNRYRYDNLVYVDLPNSPNYFQFYIKGNFIKYGTSFQENLCDVCGQYESIVGPSMCLGNITQPLPDGFYQSDLWFGSGNEKSPVMVISPVTKEKIEKEKFKNIIYAKIELKNSR